MTQTTTVAPLHRPGITDTSATPHVKLHGVGFRDARWTAGFWADRDKLCRETMVPTMSKLMEETECDKFLGNFLVAAGLAEGKHRGPRWDDGDFYKWLEGAAALLAFQRDPKLEAHLDELIATIAKAQEPDGYIHTDVTIKQKAGLDVKRFGNPMDFEMYNFGHLMLAACVHHRATGKTNLLELATRAADYLCEEFKSPTPEQARNGICPIHLSGLIEMYRTLKDKRYLKLAITLLNMRELVTKGDDDNQDRIPFRDQRVAAGHAVRLTYLYTGAADIYTETGDETLLPPLLSVWQDLIDKKLYITGGCGALFDGASPDGIEDQAVIMRVHQSFGRNYQLPQSTAHNETCGAIGNVLWSWRMLQITGESRFADVIEQTMYNSVLAGMSLDGTRYFYTNTLRQLNPMPVPLRWPRYRQPSLDCLCCPPNVVRMVAESSQYAYAVSDRGVRFVMYGSSTLDTTLPDGTQIKLTQETDYPWDGKVRVTIGSASKECSLLLRIPAWADGATVRVAGNNVVQSAKAGTFHEVRRAWQAGDVVELNLPMPAKLVEANPYVEEALGQVAVTRGPIVYCLESDDLPKDVRVLDVRLPADAKFTPERGSGALAGVTILRGKAIAFSRGGWSGGLYRDFVASKARQIDVKMVPYFAWGNRSECEMTVFVPLAM